MLELPWTSVQTLATARELAMVTGVNSVSVGNLAAHIADKPRHWGTRSMPVDPAALLRSLETEQRGTIGVGE